MQRVANLRPVPPTSDNRFCTFPYQISIPHHIYPFSHDAVFFPVLSTGGPSAHPAPVAHPAPAAAVVGLPMGPQLRMEPYFAEEDLFLAGHSGRAPALTRNVTVTVGQTAFLECRVRNLGAKRVSQSVF